MRRSAPSQSSPSCLRPRASSRSIAAPRLLALRNRNASERSGAATLPANGGRIRPGSPPGGSTLTTSAPRSARMRPASAPRRSVRSTTRRWASGSATGTSYIHAPNGGKLNGRSRPAHHGGAMTKADRRLDTKLIHAGEPEPRIEGAVAMPIFQSSTYEYAGATSYHDLKYIRLNNTPNHRVLHAKLAALENAESALVTASGMAAISTTLLTLLGAGDHLLAQDCLYGGTHDFITRDFPALGLKVDFIDADAPASWESKLRPESRTIYVETMSNPLLQVGDLEAIVAFARSHGLVS